MKNWPLLGSVTVLLVAGCQSTVSNQQSTETVPEPELEDNDPIEDEELNDQSEEEGTSGPEEVIDEESEEPEYMYEINDVLWTVEPLEDVESNVVLATFDDAPDTYSLEIAETLKEHDVSAIFFVNGHFLETEEEKELLREIHSMGFEIGNHTMTHQDLKLLSEEEQREEIVEVNNLVEEITGERPRFFRAPFGSNTDYSRELVAEEEMTLMNWTYGYDWESEYQNAASLADIMVTSEFLQDGANLLMHDRQWTNEALTDIINGIRAEDYEFVDPALIK
ncbi:polysaccharide deacetylase family protein [Alkalicoccobacillus porphyridii]|uniref:Polysaccharide deacetylase family protein n=1 Tax=Alkalicoccobacillus porphyridii TaxID=2597270 RepID=A0A553ZUY7_9BACI|nr:polysaccharide deacetylase family protein [Alkalicoccobacillus porphyridii]TSB45301.1 polysaccharide deacetylase family protein [Alkalicoccobacillus porphyridii]